MTKAMDVLGNEGLMFKGPKAIAWFKDPAGHILSVLQEK
jgi:hypothetical protein